ncbi:uncharacterized protein LOC123525484 [Mercenaria mercenaria]|uniref:uncharacterized protein LOC123525484 n=1 Tax=Mercenaria mercenaria TaxID=6596 RepID=UPI00234ED356|nr:uncharacterized protein LOC123525484 [Mercenaria mercenaria]
MASHPKSMGVIEGYQVFTNDVQPDVKQEPVDPEFDKVGQSENDANEGNKKSIRDLLKQLVENRSKELTVKTVVENLLQQNEVLLAQSDAQALKPNPRTVKPKNTEQNFESHGSILTPKDPTVSCSKEDMPNINNALVEVNVNEANTTNCDPDLVCAVGSKIILMTPQGQPLQMDITYYWCNFCSYKSEKKATLLQHVMEHRFHCKYCKFQSFSRAAVIHHCTEEHESFAETATTLKYCTYLPDLLQKNELKKRKQDGGDVDAPGAKRARVEHTELLNMEVEEVDASDTSKPVEQTKIIKPSLTVSGNSADSTPVVATTENNGLPVISSVMSGHQAVSEALTSTKPPPEKQPTPKRLSSVTPATATAPAPAPASIPVSTPASNAASGVTVSSGLCWNCGYCGFVTLSQAFLKIHLNAQHQAKAHKYVAMLVSSEEEMARIKASDAQLVTNPSGGGVIVPVTPVKPSDLPSAPGRSSLPTTLPAPTPKPGIEIDNAESDTPKVTHEETEEEKKIPVSYKCAHCNFSYPQEDKVRIHLFQRHSGCVIYALDMKAVKLRQKRYIFFCLKTKCSFKTKETDEYLEHISKCTPWLDGTERKDVDAGMVKSLELTKTFIEKTANGMSFGKDTRPEKTAEYACIYCSYISNNNTRLKKHVMTNHADKSCIIKDVPASRANRKSSVYFCNYCLWETREGSELELHLAERHNTATKTKPAMETEASASSKPSSKPEENKPTPASEKKPEPEKKTSPVLRKRRQVQEKSEERETPSPEANEYKSDNDENANDEEELDENEYEGIIPSAKYQKAMAAYIASENPDTKKARGRPSRNAALKCRIKVKSIKAPPLYKCLHCEEVHFGTKLMRNHLRLEHKNQPLRAIDVLKQEKKYPNFYICFCPSDNCAFCEPVATDVLNHAKNKHGISATNNDLVRIMNVYSGPSTSARGRPATAATGESYECLYCSQSKLYHSRRDMKKHLIDEHNGEEFIFRDCIARKLRQPSRFYMCHNITCDFTSEKQKDYLLHMLGHQKAKIYECSKCQWFTSVEGEIDNHLASVHNGEGITTLEIDLDLDSLGNTLKLVGGTVIKTEK